MINWIIKPFRITYYSAKDKKTITRNGLNDDKSIQDTTKADRAFYCYWDVDAGGYRKAMDSWTICYKVEY